MPTQVATAIISAVVTGIMLFTINLITPIFSQSQVELEYTMDTAYQLMPMTAKFLPSTGVIDFIQHVSEKIDRSKNTDMLSGDDGYLVSNLISNKKEVQTLRDIGNFECATFINISNKSNLTATNVKIVVGPSADGIISDGAPFQFHLPLQLPSFTEITDNKNIGDLSPGDSRQYIVLSRLGQYSCNKTVFSAPLYRVVHDKGIAYLDQFPHTYGLLYLALRHQFLSYIFISAGMYVTLGLLIYLVIWLVKSISTALRGTTPPA
jgi:hypothetical protein